MLFFRVMGFPLRATVNVIDNSGASVRSSISISVPLNLVNIVPIFRLFNVAVNCAGTIAPPFIIIRLQGGNDTINVRLTC